MRIKFKGLFKKKQKEYLYDSNKFLVAFKGIRIVYTEESSFRYQVMVLMATIFLGFLLKIVLLEWIIITLLAIIVLTLEILNTAIENVVDMVSPEYNKIAGKIKDIAAGSVLISSIGSIVIGI
ncbi:MAG: diacylglycerol kinase family protein, partial [Bacilli bacterium]|nr:diacylglycerol kinase family protein [Bacilli bacterium]